MADDANEDELQGGPELSEPPTEWPADLLDPEPGADAEEDDDHAVPPDLLELHEVLEAGGIVTPGEPA